MANTPILNFTSVDNSLAYQLYQGLLASGAALADMDVGEGLINYTGKECPNQASTCLVGAHDGKVTSNEVFEFALNNYEKYQKLIEGTLRSPLPWVLDDQDSTTTFDANVRAKVQAAIDILKFNLITTQALKDGSDEYKENLALGLFYLAMVPDSAWIQKNELRFNQLTAELVDHNMGWYQEYLRSNGGFYIESDFNEEYSVLDSIALGRGKCTEQSKKLFAFFRMAGLSPVFTYIPASGLKVGKVLNKRNPNLQKELDQGLENLPRGESHISIGLQLQGELRVFDLALLCSEIEFQYYYVLSLRQYLSMDLSSRATFSGLSQRTDEEVIYSNQSLLIDSKNAQAYASRGSFYSESEPDIAIENYTKALQIDPQYGEVFFGRAKVWGYKGEFDKAIADYTEALRIDPQDATAYFNRGIALDAKGELDKAIADYTKALRIDPEYDFAYCNRGVDWDKKGEFDKAIADYTEALRINPQDSNLYFSRAMVWGHKGELDKAIADYTQALRINPKYDLAYYNRGNAWDNKGEVDKAIADYTQAIQINPRLADAYSNRGILLGKKGEVDKAIADYTQAIQINPRLAPAYFNRGLSLDDKGELDKAIADYTQAIQINPNMGGAYCVRGSILYQKGNVAEAIIDFSSSMKNNFQTNWDKGLVKMVQSKWQQESQKTQAAQFEAETSFDIAKVEAIFIYSYSLWLAGNQQEAIQKLKIVSEALSFKTPPSDATKVFFESQFQLMPKAMSQDAEIQKIVASIKAKIK